MVLIRLALGAALLASASAAQELSYTLDTPRLSADIALSKEAEAWPALAGALRRDALAALDEVKAWAAADTTTPRPYEFEITDRAVFVSPEAVSILRNTYIDSGGAHPNMGWQTWNWDVARAQMMGLEALFPQGSPAYAAISASLRQQIAREVYDGEPIGDYWIGIVEEATAPDPASLHNFTLAAGDAPGVAVGLDFYYAPYAVAAYAFGPHVISVRRDVFGAYLLPSRRALFGLSP